MANEIDKRGRLEEEIFAYEVSKGGKVFIKYEGKTVTILQGPSAEKFLSKINGLEGQAAQLVMAKVTGNFKHGNERTAKQHSSQS